MTVLQYADAFESFLAQIDDYDEAQYLVHFIFGLQPEIMRLVYMQQPASLLAAKNMAEKLELTDLATSEPYPRTKKQKTSKTQHRGTQERRSSGHNQQKTHRPVQRQRQRRMTEPAQYRGCVSARSGALVEASCPAFHRRSPRCCWPCRPEWKRCRCSRWAMGVAPSSVRTHASQQSSESGRGDETPAALSTRVPRTEAALHTPSPKNVSLQARGGEAQCRPLSQGRLLYTMMMSAAVLARGLIGTC